MYVVDARVYVHVCVYTNRFINVGKIDSELAHGTYDCH